jgi:hypothetical protein
MAEITKCSKDLSNSMSDYKEKKMNHNISFM